jgi:hypothetical protein
MPHKGTTSHIHGGRAAELYKTADHGLRSGGPSPTRRRTECLYSFFVARRGLGRLDPWSSAYYSVGLRRIQHAVVSQ